VLTKWTVTQTNRFKAAAAGAGASSWAVMYMLGDLRQHREYWFGGPPWTSQEVLDNYWKDSPIGAKKRPFESHSILNLMILPRQARDKHRNKLRKQGVF
jgi:hypothetical protein